MKYGFVATLLSLGLFLQSTGTGLAANPVRPTINRKPVAPATINSAKPTNKSTSSNQKKTKGTSASITNAKKNYPSDEGSQDPLILGLPAVPIIDPDEVLEEHNRVRALIPQTSVAVIKEDPSFRLLVTINGTEFSQKSKDSFELKKGSVFVCPENNIAVKTPACELILHEGSVVTIDVTKSTTYIRDFHDRWRGHVVVKTEHLQDIHLMPGVEVIVTSETDPQLAWTHAIRHQIRRRGLVKLVSDANHTIYKGEFSIPDAMLKSNHFVLLHRTSDDKVKHVIDEVMKTAALLHMNDTRGPFSLLTQEAPLVNEIDQK